ncbi:hypothetical protein BN2127_JRS1_05305 [Bacillus cereus]|nr:hypothetical protein BN2127_JRS1_05305 [Bacillus cereus]
MKKSSNETNLVIEKYSRNNELKVKQLLKSFPFNPCATWITYQKEVGK